MEAAVKRLHILFSQLTPQVSPDLARDLEQIYYTLRNHVYFLEYQKRQLDELRAELDRV